MPEGKKKKKYVQEEGFVSAQFRRIMAVYQGWKAMVTGVALSMVVVQAGNLLTSLWNKKPKELSLKAGLNKAHKDYPKQPTSSSFL